MDNKPLLNNQQGYQPTGSPTQQGYQPTGQPGYQPTGQPQVVNNQSGYQPTGSPMQQHQGGQPGYQPTGQPQGQQGYQPTGSPMQQHQGGQQGYQPTGQPQGQQGYQPTGSPMQQHQGGQQGYQPTGQGQQGYQPSGPPIQGQVQLDDDTEEYIEVSETVGDKTFECVGPPVDFVPEEILSTTEFTPVLDVPDFDENDARIALEQYVRTTTCLRRDYSGEININQFDTSNAYVVKLETFTEERRIVDDYRPYRGGFVDGPQFGIPPGPWEIVASPPGLFVNHIHSMPLPHTEEVRFCFRCHGRGRIRCYSCRGSGEESCGHCGASGWVRGSRYNNRTQQHESYEERCHHCHGNGYRMCYRCSGRGRITCDVCEGERDLVYFSRLDIIWETPTNDAVIKEAFDPELQRVLPDRKLKSAQGPLVYGLEEYMIQPVYDDISTRVNDRVNDAANQLIDGSVDPMRYHHRQRLTVRGLPVYEIGYLDGHSQKRFWVYGTDHRVHAPQYPWSIQRILFTITIILLVLGGAGFAIYWFGFHEQH